MVDIWRRVAEDFAIVSHVVVSSPTAGANSSSAGPPQAMYKPWAMGITLEPSAAQSAGELQMCLSIECRHCPILNLRSFLCGLRRPPGGRYRSGAPFSFNPLRGEWTAGASLSPPCPHLTGHATCSISSGPPLDKTSRRSAVLRPRPAEAGRKASADLPPPLAASIARLDPMALCGAGGGRRGLVMAGAIGSVEAPGVWKPRSCGATRR